MISQQPEKTEITCLKPSIQCRCGQLLCVHMPLQFTWQPWYPGRHCVLWLFHITTITNKQTKIPKYQSNKGFYCNDEYLKWLGKGRGHLHESTCSYVIHPCESGRVEGVILCLEQWFKGSIYLYSLKWAPKTFNVHANFVDTNVNIYKVNTHTQSP